MWSTGIALGIVVMGIATGLIPPPKHALADSSHIVSIYFDGQKKVITTNSSTVGAALNEAGVPTAAGDAVEPGVNATIPAGFFNINVYRSRPVVVVDGATHKTVQTAAQSPALIAQAAGLKVYPEDTYGISTIGEVTEAGVVGQQVVIHRAVPVILVADGTQVVVRTQQKTVSGLLSERDVALGPQDTTSPGNTTPITAGMTIQISRVKVVVLKQTDTIARDTKTIDDPTLDAGTTKVQSSGSDGQKVTTFRVHYQNGTEQSREQLSQEVIAQPVAQVVLNGTKVTNSSDPVKLGEQLAAKRGWTGSQWNAVYQIFEHESGWNPSSRSGSGACGIPQAYPCSKISDHSAAGQINWGLDYIAGKYGDPNSAWSHWQSNHSY